jgi:hypothetical protein
LAAPRERFWRPRILLSPALVARLDADALDATTAHEAARLHHLFAEFCRTCWQDSCFLIDPLRSNFDATSVARGALR